MEKFSIVIEINQPNDKYYQVIHKLKFSVVIKFLPVNDVHGRRLVL